MQLKLGAELGGVRAWCQIHLITEALETFDQITFEAAAPEFVEVVGSEIVVLDILFEHVVDDDQQRVSDRQQSPFLAAACDQSAVLGRQIAVLGA